MKKPFKHQVTRLPKILTCQRDFYQVDSFMAMVEKGEVNVAVSGDELNGLIVMKSLDKVSYSVVDNLEPWCDFFSQVAIATNTPYDDKPMRQFITKLKVDMPLTLKNVQQVKEERHAAEVEPLLDEQARIPRLEEFRSRIHPEAPAVEARDADEHPGQDPQAEQAFEVETAVPV